jgi:hypothetical protein
MLAEGGETLAQAAVRRMAKIFKSTPEQFVLVLDGRAEIDALRVERRDIDEIARAEQIFFAQAVGADEQRVAREGREGLVRRVAVAGRPQR